MTDLLCKIEPCNYERGGRCTYPRNLSGCTYAPTRQQAERETFTPPEPPEPLRRPRRRRKR